MKTLILTLLIASTLSFNIPGGGCENPYNSSEYTYMVVGAGPGGSNQFYHVIDGNTYEINAYQNALLCWAWDR